MTDESKRETPETEAFIKSCEERHLSIWDALTAIQGHARDLERRLSEAQEERYEARTKWRYWMDAFQVAEGLREERSTSAKDAERRLSEILILIDGMEDIDSIGGPNLAMRIGMIAKGEDRP